MDSVSPSLGQQTPPSLSKSRRILQTPLGNQFKPTHLLEAQTISVIGSGQIIQVASTASAPCRSRFFGDGARKDEIKILFEQNEGGPV
jgi:hypothetical protein